MQYRNIMRNKASGHYVNPVLFCSIRVGDDYLVQTSPLLSAHFSACSPHCSVYSYLASLQRWITVRIKNKQYFYLLNTMNNLPLLTLPDLTSLSQGKGSVIKMFDVSIIILMLTDVNRLYQLIEC